MNNGVARDRSSTLPSKKSASVKWSRSPPPVAEPADPGPRLRPPTMAIREQGRVRLAHSADPTPPQLCVRGQWARPERRWPTSVVPVGGMFPDPPPTRRIARHPWPADDPVEGSPVEGADTMATGLDSHEPSEFRSAFESSPSNRGPSLFLGAYGSGVKRPRAEDRNRPGCHRADGHCRCISR
jgi:hypothetical protein